MLGGAKTRGTAVAAFAVVLVLCVVAAATASTPGTLGQEGPTHKPASASLDVRAARIAAVRIAGSTSRFLTAPSGDDAAAIALDYLRANLDLFGLDTADVGGLQLHARYTSPDGITHLTWQQTVDGIPSYDTYFSANVDSQGQIVNVGGSPVSALAPADSEADLGPSGALQAAAEDVGGSAGRQLAPAQGPARETRFAAGDTASLVVLADPSGDHLGWRVVVDGEAGTYEEVVDADSGEPLVRNLLTEDAFSASVFQNYPGAPSGGTASTVSLAPDSTWLDNSSGNTRLWGNNSQAYADLNDNNADDGASEDVPASSGTDWLYPQTAVSSPTGNCGLVPNGCSWDPAVAGSKETNRKQATTQAFFYVNSYHDWLLQTPIGFDEASHNFERVHTSAAAGAGDPVLTEANDGNGVTVGTNTHRNNANMSTPADGTSPRMQMYLFYNSTNPAWPAVNGDDDASVVYHEYTHGLSNRLVGNGVGGSLSRRQSQAMGEGWSDWYALDYLNAQGFAPDTATPGEMIVGRYVTGDTTKGIRNQAIDCPVSFTSSPCNGSANAPSGGFTFADMGRVSRLAVNFPAFEVHADGEIWVETLWDLRQALGASVARGLITNAMRLAPVNPGMLEMRDAILQADLPGGSPHRDQIWQVFATRGMGYGAKSLSPSSTRGSADFSVPPLADPGPLAVSDPGPLGDGDGVAEPGEALRLDTQLSNPDTTSLTNVQATLSSSTPGVAISQPTASYGTIAAGGTASPSAPFGLSLPAATLCTARVGLSLQVSSDQGAATVPLDDLTLGSGTQTFTATPAAPIPDFSAVGATSTISISGLPAGTTVSNLHAGLDVTHTWIGDVRAELTHGATTVALVDRPGVIEGSQANNLTGLDLFDSAASSVQEAPNAEATPARTGAQRPDEPLSRFEGAEAAGTWTLKVYDVVAGDTGTVNSWSVTVPNPACALNLPAPSDPDPGGGSTPSSGGSSTPTPAPPSTPTPKRLTCKKGFKKKKVHGKVRCVKSRHHRKHH